VPWKYFIIKQETLKTYFLISTLPAALWEALNGAFSSRRSRLAVLFRVPGVREPLGGERGELR
jgi:hypothetical protein